MTTRSTANRYVALRHGESEANVQGIILSDPARGVPGDGLTDAGKGQVRASIASSDLDANTLIYSSDFARAHQTAELAPELLGAPEVRLIPSLREYSRLYQITGDRLARAKPGAFALHPGPINEGVEISAEVAHGTRSLIEEQVTNGVAVRMAVIYLLLRGGKPE